MQKFLHEYFYEPKYWQRLLSHALLPISWLYSLIAVFIYERKKKNLIDFNLPIFGVGNLRLGGSGKTPLCKALYEYLKVKNIKSFIVLRGYKRQSQGLKLVYLDEKLLSNYEEAGDEAMEYAYLGANTIVSEDAKLGVKKAIELGARAIILDDSFSKSHIKKLNILLEGQGLFYDRCLPSGALRMPSRYLKEADFLAKENESYERKSFIKSPVKGEAVLISSIANPKRLEQFFPLAKALYLLNDHEKISKSFVLEKLAMHNASVVLCTRKDAVKMQGFGIELAVIELELRLNESFCVFIDNYLKGFDAGIK